MSTSEEAFDQELEREVSARLAIMEDPDYEYPESLGKIDWVLITVCPIVCLGLLILGEFL